MQVAEHTVGADEARRAPFRVAIAPFLSVFSAARDAAGADRSGTPASWCDAIRSHWRGRDYDVLAPLVTPRVTVMPDSLVPLPQPPGERIEEAIERIAATPGDVLLRELHDELGTPPPVWRPVERDPERWLRGYACAMMRAWKGFAPVWRIVNGSMDREVQRIALAAAFDAQLELLGTLHPSGRVCDGAWRLPSCHGGGELAIARDGLVVVPMVAGTRASVVAYEDGRLAHLAYPMPKLPPAVRRLPEKGDLDALLGEPRAKILRRLDRPATAGELAQALLAVPSAATHHVSALEAAGLVRRERRGRHVVVRRTARGEALLALYEVA